MTDWLLGPADTQTVLARQGALPELAARLDLREALAIEGVVVGQTRGVTVEGKPANLLETVAERIAAALLKHPEVIQVTVRVTKRPPLPNLNAFSVEITRPAD